MDLKIVEQELRTQKIRQGIIYKRTKFLQEWRERWMVLTSNYIFVFTNKTLKELTESVDLRDVKSYKSYVRKDDQMIPAGFKIRTLEDMYYFCARNCNQKWTWMVSLERLMDFKCSGKSPYNNAQFIKTKGFMSQAEFQRGKYDEPTSPTKSLNLEVSSTPKPTEQDIQKLAKYLEQQIPRLHEKEQAIALKGKQQEEIFNSELKKLKESEEYVKGLRFQYEEKIREADQRVRLAEAKTKQVLDLLTHQSKLSIEEITELTKSIAETNTTVAIEIPVLPEQPVDNIEKPKDTAPQYPIAASQPNHNYFIGPVSVNFIKYVEEVVQPPIMPSIQEPIVRIQPIRLYFRGPASVETLQSPEVAEPEPIIQNITQALVNSEPVRVYFRGPVYVENLQSPEVVEPEPITQSLINSEPIRAYFRGPIIVQNQIQWLVATSEEKLYSQQEIVVEIPLVSKESKGSIVAQMKRMYESKITEENIRTSTAPLVKKNSVIKEQKKSKDEFLHQCRQKVVLNLFEEFHAQAYTYTGLKPILQFLVQMTADRGLGYQQYVVSECKAHENRFFFAETLLDLIEGYRDYEKSDKLCNVIEVIIFEAPGIFKANHLDKIKSKLIDLFDHSPEASVVVKTMHAVHKFKKFSQDEELKAKLQRFIAGQQSAESKVWAKKLLEDQ